MTRLPQDYRARLTVQTEFDAPLVVEAGAGTGKTSVLTARILYWILAPGWEAVEKELSKGQGGLGVHDLASRVMSRVLALTFTDAAAAEMRSRIVQGLRVVASGGHPGPDLLVSAEFLEDDPDGYRFRAKALMAASHLLASTTIHAFCKGLLSAHPLQAGLHPIPFVDPEGHKVEEIVARILAEDLLPQYRVEGNATVLSGLGIRPSVIRKLLFSFGMQSVPAEVFRRRSDEPKSFESVWKKDEMLEIAMSLSQAADSAMEMVVGSASKTKETLELLQGLARGIETKTTSQDLLVWLSGFFDHERVGMWCDGRGKTKTERTIFEAFPQIVSGLDGLWRLFVKSVMGPLKELVFPMARRLDQELAARGLLTYEAMLRRAADLIASHDDVASGLRHGLDLLVVDEFQDTDQTQCDIVAMLALKEADGPSLMLVGDPKQSIYGFRSADLEAYHRFLESVFAQGGRRLVLDANFRSHEVILDEVERLVAPVMVESAGLQPAFQRLTAARESEPLLDELRKPVEFWVFPYDQTGGAEAGKVRVEAGASDGAQVTLEKRRAEEQARIEAEVVARDIAAMHRMGVPWSDVALLFRSTTHIEPFVQALDRHDVPYVASSSRGYFQREEVVAAVSLLQAVLDPEDHMALAAALRSVVCGVPDAALAPLWWSGEGLAGRLDRLVEQRRVMEGADQEEVRQGAEKRYQDLWSALVDDVSGWAEKTSALPEMDGIEGWNHSVLQFLDALVGLRVALHEQSTDRFMEMLRDLTGIEVIEAAAFDGRRRLANLQALFDELAATMEEEAADPLALARMLRKALEDTGRSETDRPDTATDAVSVLTIHKAKGLGFGHLYFVQAGATLRGRPSKADVEFVHRGGTWEFKVKDFSSDGWDDAMAARKRRETAEAIRLFYVAATRAKKRLVFVGGWGVAQASSRSKKATGFDPSDMESALSDYVEILQRRPMPDTGGAESARSARDAMIEVLAQGRRSEGAGPAAVVFDGSFGGQPLVRWVVFSPEAETISNGVDQWLVGQDGDIRDGAVGDGDQKPDPGPADGSRDEVIASMRPRVESLDTLRARAAKVMERPLSASPSGWKKPYGLDDVDFRDDFTAGPAAFSQSPGNLGLDPAEQDGGSSEGSDRAVRSLAGVLVHRALQHWDPGRPLAQELERVCELLPAWALSSAQNEEDARRASGLARVLLERFASPGGLGNRLAAVGSGIIGREVPILLPAEGDGAPRGGADQNHVTQRLPVGHFAGRVDLVYRDPDSGILVVADYKTERVDGMDDERISAVAQAYVPQLRIYASAVGQALGQALRAEVWFIEGSRVVELFEWGPPSGQE